MTRALPQPPPALGRRPLLLLLAAVAAPPLACATTRPRETPAAVRIGAPLPELEMTALDGGAPLALAGLRGKVVLLDVWASWCPPCKEELPLLDELAGRLKSQGIEIVAVSIDEDVESARAFLRGRASWGITFAHDPRGGVADTLQPPKMPTSYVLDRAGVLRVINAGFDRDDLPRLEATLVELARGSSP